MSQELHQVGKAKSVESARGPNEGENRGEEHAIRKNNEKAQTAQGAHFERLTFRLELIVIFVQPRLLADAEFGKDGIQYVLRRDFTGNGAQMVQNFADVLSEQVSGNASCKSILGPVRGSACGF